MKVLVGLLADFWFWGLVVWKKGRNGGNPIAIPTENSGVAGRRGDVGEPSRMRTELEHQVTDFSTEKTEPQSSQGLNWAAVRYKAYKVLLKKHPKVSRRYGLTMTVGLSRTKKMGMQPKRKVRLKCVRENGQNYFLHDSTQEFRETTNQEQWDVLTHENNDHSVGITENGWDNARD